MCANYVQFYGDNIGKDIIEKLSRASSEDTTAPRLPLAVQTVRSLGLCILSIFTLGVWLSWPAKAEQANACSANSAREILAAVQENRNIPRIQGVPSFDIAPIAGPMSLALRHTFGTDSIDNYRVVVQFDHDPIPTDTRTAVAEGTQISAMEIPETNTMRTSNLVAQHDTLLALNTPVPPVARGLRGWAGTAA
jgi:hypothetical protein